MCLQEYWSSEGDQWSLKLQLSFFEITWLAWYRYDWNFQGWLLINGTLMWSYSSLHFLINTFQHCQFTLVICIKHEFLFLNWHSLVLWSCSLWVLCCVVDNDGLLLPGVIKLCVWLGEASADMFLRFRQSSSLLCLRVAVQHCESRSRFRPYLFQRHFWWPQQGLISVYNV